MRTYFVLFAFYFISSIGFGQKLQLEKASPFTAVKWENNQPIVKFNTKWYTLEKLDVFTTKELLDFCKQEFGDKWQKRFSEDLVEVLKKMDAPPKKEVQLILSSGKHQENVIGIYTLQNRKKVRDYNAHIIKKEKNLKRAKKITTSQAVEDIELFQQIIEKRSSYIQLTDYNYKKAIKSLKNTVETSKKDVDINYLTHELSKIMAEIGDRHSSVKNEAFVKEEHPTYNLQLPFSIAPLNGKIVALNKIDKEGVYEYFNTGFPFVKSINNIPVNMIIDSLVYKSKKAPKAAKFTAGVSEIQQLGKLYFINNLKLPKQIKVVFTNGKVDKIVFVQLQNKTFRYRSKLERNMDLKSKAIEEKDFEGIAKILDGNIGLISLPRMYNFDKTAGLEQFIDSTFASFNTTNALIIDVRYNPGGTRHLIQKIACYIIPQTKSPWVANVAYLRTDEKNVIHNSMSSRFLYIVTSNKLNDVDRKSINKFSENFTLQKEFDSYKFSTPHYMVLKNENTLYTKPIYILVNERSFSAATVFTSAFKSLPNVKIVGVTTDGSSGNSKENRLKHSNIRVKVSTMLSFQRNGKTLDGNGTKPDIYISENEEQVLKGADIQLKKLVEIINTKKDN